MNIFTIIGTVLHVLEQAPDLVDDVEDFWTKLSGKAQVTEEQAATVQNAITAAKQG